MKMFPYLFNKMKYIRLTSLLQTNDAVVTNRCFLSNDETTDNCYKIDFTLEQQKKVLDKLNTADVQTLQRYRLPKNRIKKLDDWKQKHGQFNDLNDILDVDGLGVKSLNKLCSQILQGEFVENIVNEKSVKGRQFLTPSINGKDLESSLGIHLYANGISWARIEKLNNCLTDWNYFEFNLGTKKLSPIDALQLVMSVSKEIPTSDVYIFEAPMAVTPTAQQSAISVAAYVQRIQLLSMLITLLSTSPKHNPNCYNSNEEKQFVDFSGETNVYFLRHRLAARLFRTLIGTEKVSSAMVVSNILEKKSMEKIVYTPITITQNLDCMYARQIPVVKEVLGQALFLTMAFMDVCVYQNKNSLKSVSSNRS